LNIAHEIRERRILPAVGVYVGGSWVVVEILDRLVERYFLSPYLTDIVFWGLFSLLPAVFLLSWTHGRPGKDRATRVEKVGIPVNIIATLGLLLTLFGGKNLSATADLVTIDNELGQKEEHYIPKDAFRRRVAVFFWSNESGDAQQDWLQYAVTELLTQDLQQNAFLVASSPWEHSGRGYYARMKAAGFDDGLDVPLNLKREIADAANRTYFLDGSLMPSSQGYRVSLRVWETENLTQLGEVTGEGADLLEVVDQLASAVRDVLEIPTGRSGSADDLPLRETYGYNEAALRAFVDGRNVLLFENDWERSNALYEAAIAADPGFVLAWFYMGLNQWEQGDAAGAQASLTRAQEYAYRLPERDQTMLKGLSYRISGDQDKLEKFLRLQVRLHRDAVSHRDLARFLMITGRLEEAKQQFQEVTQRDRSDLKAYLHLAILEQASGNTDAAITYAERFLVMRPNDLAGHLLIGDLYLERGDFEAARQFYEEAQLIEDTPVAPTLRLVALAARQGQWARARELIGEARQLSNGARHDSAILAAEGALELRFGRISRAIELAEQQSEVNREILSPVEQIFAYNMPVIQYNIMLNRLQVADDVLASALGALQPPLNHFLSFVGALLHARRGDYDAAEAAVADGAEAIDRFKADYLAFQIPLIRAFIAEEKQDYSAAARLFEEAILGAKRSVIATELQGKMGQLYGACAQMHVRAGELDLAQDVLDQAFRRDTAEPSLWMARAMLEDANGSAHLALASVNYALAIWADADAEYLQYQEALALREHLRARAK
jgi:tetratricopeptide (TPR) repeat protein